MYWTDVAVDREISCQNLQRAWAQALGLQTDAVAIIADFAATDPWADPCVRLTIERRFVAGEFPLRLALVIGEAELDAQVQTDEAMVEVVQRFCVELGCRVLTAVEDDDPSAWVLVTPSGILRVVDYDPDDIGAKVEDAVVGPLAVSVA